jgi:hypothetical protein
MMAKSQCIASDENIFVGVEQAARGFSALQLRPSNRWLTPADAAPYGSKFSPEKWNENTGDWKRRPRARDHLEARAERFGGKNLVRAG